MASEKFTISSSIIYTIESDQGSFDFRGVNALKEHAENLLGVFVDKMSSGHTGNYISDKLKDHKFLIDNKEELETIFALMDEINRITNPDCEDDDDDRYCEHCGSYTN